MVAAGNVRSLSELKTYDETDFAPPAWAKGPRFRYDALDEPVKHGESSKSGGYTEGDAAPSTRPPTVSATPDNSSIRPDLDRGRRDELQRKERLTDADLNSKQSNGENGDDEDEDGGEEVWENAADDLGGVTVDRETGQFTLHALEMLLGRGLELREEGNKYYSARPAELQPAVEKYKAALGFLPDVGRGESSESESSTSGGQSSSPTSEPAGIQEVTEDEAEAIEQEEKRKAERSPEDIERERIEHAIRECAKACWGNLGACYAALGNDAEVVKACTKALELDPFYAKALSRRALANERIGSWTALETALKDNQTLMGLLPPASPQLPGIRRALASLPDRIKEQQKKETAEMFGKFKDLGNSLLGRFGLSTDNFKFDELPDGGYTMRFER